MPDPFLIAHVVNAVSLETCRVEFEIAYEDEDGDWRTSEGRRVLPFWTIELTSLLVNVKGDHDLWFLDKVQDIVPPIPAGWIEHVHREAEKHAADHRAPDRLEALLGLVAPATPTYGTFKRRF